MRINCVGLADLLCAYADGELTDANKKLVEDHLAICDNCSSILKIYREITTAVDDTCVDPPAALVTGVMNRIVNEETPRAEKETVQRKRNKVILLRYMPIAACLVVMLLVWQFWGNTLFTGRIGGEMGGSSMYDSMPAAAPAADSGLYSEAESAEDTLRIMPEAILGEDSPDNYNVTDESDFMPQGVQRRDFNTDDIIAFIGNAYAEISITGEIPEFLQNYEPYTFDTLYGWELLFEIPRSEVFPFLAELGDTPGVDVVYNDNDSDYAVVLITSKN